MKKYFISYQETVIFTVGNARIKLRNRVIEYDGELKTDRDISKFEDFIRENFVGNNSTNYGVILLAFTPIED